MWLIKWIFSYRQIIRFRSFRNLLYTKWISTFLGELGKKSIICYPCCLEGEEGVSYVTIGNNTRIESHCIIGCRTHYAGDQYRPQIVIGDNCNIGEYNHISAINSIKIGNGFLTGRFVTITDNSHGVLDYKNLMIIPSKRKLVSKGEIVIGNNVWVGDKVTILPGVHIGDNVIIGANAVVTKNIPSNSIWGGVPSKECKKL